MSKSSITTDGGPVDGLLAIHPGEMLMNWRRLVSAPGHSRIV